MTFETGGGNIGDRKQIRLKFLLSVYEKFCEAHPTVLKNNGMVDILNNKYWAQWEEIQKIMQPTAEGPARIDIHKIIATTELVIMQHLLVRERGEGGAWIGSIDDAADVSRIREINADFSIFVAISMLSTWYKTGNHPIDIKWFTRERCFLQAHRLWLMNYAGSKFSFPLFALSQIWYLFDILSHQPTDNVLNSNYLRD